MKLAIRSLFLFTVLLPVSVAAQVTEDQKLTGSGGGDFAEFGSAVALVETEAEALALIGAPGDNERGEDAGAVYAYHYDEGTERWVEEAKFWPEKVGENSFVGFSAALSADGQLAFVSGLEPGPDTAPLFGRVHIFRRVDGAWVEMTTLAASDETPRNAFGCSVAVSADGAVVVIGACGADGSAPLTGAVYIFRRDKAVEAWVEEAKLTTERPCFFNNFGAAVDVSAAGDRVVVGEPCGEGGDPSALHFLARSGPPDGPNGGWEREALFDPMNGSAVGLSAEGDLALAGPLFFSTVVVLEREETVWSETGTITSDSSSPGGFGEDSIVLNGAFALIGDTGADIQDNSEGAAFLFQRGGNGTWIEETMLVASDGEEFDGFGYAMFLSERFALVGAPRDDEEDSAVGAVYAFDLARVVPTEQEGPVGSKSVRLSTLYPNPSQDEASVMLMLAEATKARVAVFDVLGRRVAVLYDGPLGAGAHRLRLDAAALPAGVYVVRAVAGSERITRTLVVAR